MSRPVSDQEPTEHRPASGVETAVDSVLIIDGILWLAGLALCIALTASRAPWVLAAGGAALGLIATILILHRRRRRAQITRWRQDRLARRHGRRAQGA